MRPTEKIRKWQKLGNVPDLFFFHKGYPVKAYFDYNDEVSYMAVIPFKKSAIIKTTKKTFEHDVKREIDVYVQQNKPQKQEFIALISHGNSFSGYLPDISDELIVASTLDELRYELTHFAQMAVMELNTLPQASTLSAVLNDDSYGDDIPMLISLEIPPAL